MARGRPKKKPAKQTQLQLQEDSNDSPTKDPQIEITDPFVERQIAGIRAIFDIEIEHLLTELRLLRSYFNEEQLKTPVLQFFAENFPKLSIEKDGENGRHEVKWISEMKGPMHGRDFHASLLHRLSTAYSDFSAPISTFGGYEFSSKAGKTRRLAPDALQIRDFVLEEPSETLKLGMQEAFQTPGISSSRLSVGMTPKTLRLPKPGEMLLSVRGSPLGVYKEEENMEAIHESEEG